MGCDFNRFGVLREIFCGYGFSLKYISTSPLIDGITKLKLHMDMLKCCAFSDVVNNYNALLRQSQRDLENVLIHCQQC